MIEGWTLWLLLVGLATGAAGTAVLLVRLPREEDDLGELERRTEAAWIGTTIERQGGIAPSSLVEEVLDLHRAYLVMARVPAPRGASAPPIPPMPPMDGLPPPPGSVPPPGYAPPPGAVPPGAASPPGSMPPGAVPPPGSAPPGAVPPPGPPAGAGSPPGSMPPGRPSNR